METLEQLRARMLEAIPGAEVTLVANAPVPGQSSFLIDRAHIVEAAKFLRNDPLTQFDYASNVTGVDWLDVVTQEKVRVKKEYQGGQIEVDEIVQKTKPGYIEVVYHLYSMALKHGPVILRVRTGDRKDQNHVPSLTPIYRGAEFQEREVYDLFGVVFDGHPDMRRLLMWEEFQDHPMRKDYIEPDDYQYEPTPHDEVLDKARRHYPKEAPHA